MTADLSNSSTPAITRAAAILSVLATQPQRAFGPSELSRKTGIPKSSVFNLCAELSRVGFLRRHERGVRLNHRLAELGNAYLRSLSEIEEFYEACRVKLPNAIQTIQLAVLGSGLTVVFVARHEGREPLNLGRATETTRSVPAHCTAAGKALLAALGDASLRQLLPRSRQLPGITNRSIRTVELLEAELASIRNRGHATGFGEVVSGRSCFAVAVRTPHRADGLLGISFSFPEASDGKLPPNILVDLRDFAEHFAGRIGGTLAF